MFFTNINLLTVLAATIVGMGIGFLWYSQWLFAGLWLKSKGEGKSTVSGHLVSLVSTFVTALVLAALFNSLIITSVGGILFAGFLLWLGFMMPVKLADYVYGGDNLTLFSITTGHQLTVVIVMSLIIGLFS